MTRWTEANGASLRYSLEGSGPRTLVLVHEGGGALESWDAVVPLIAPGYRILRYDQRGFGMSERSRELTLELMVEDLRCLLDALDIQGPVDFAASAMGGSIALAFAAYHPDRVASVFATSPVAGDIPDSARNRLEERAQTVEQLGMRAIADNSLARSYPETQRGDNGPFEQFRARYLTNDPFSFAALTRAYNTISMKPIYHRIKCRALIVGCTDDVLNTAKESADMASALAHGRYVEVSSGHFFAVQFPQTFVDLLSEFLEQQDD